MNYILKSVKLEVIILNGNNSTFLLLLFDEMQRFVSIPKIYRL